MPDFYKDSSDKLDEILKGVVEKSNNQEIIDNLVKAANINREMLLDYFRDKTNSDFFTLLMQLNQKKAKN